MSRFQQISAVGAVLALLVAPMAVAHAQVMSPYGYTGTYYPTTSYPTTNSNQYYDDSYYPTSNYSNSGYNGYYPTNSYNNYYSPYQYPSPTCTLSITSPTSYYNSGNVTGTVSWTTQNASSVYLSTVGGVNTSGSISVDMYPGETFTLSITGPGGNGTCQNEYYPPAPQYQYPSYNQPYYTNPVYPTYPTTYVPPVTYVQPTTYVVPVIERAISTPVRTIQNWWQNTMHW